MKAVIVDLRDGQAAALCDDGRVIRLSGAYSLGQIVQVHERKRRTPGFMRYASAAAAAALLLVGAGGGAAYAMPYGVVSLDVNPSLEYTINRFDYVLRVEGVNEDGKALLSQMDTRQLVHHSISDALEASVQQLEAGDWLGGESDEILISAGTKQPAHAEKLIRTLEGELGSAGREIHALTVSEADIDDAHREGMSAGRHRMLDELKEREGADFAREDWKDLPIRDIFSRLENAPAGAPDHPDAHSAQPEQRGDDRPAMSPEQGEAMVQPQPGQTHQEPAQEQPARDAQPQGESAQEAFSRDAQPQQEAPPHGGQPQAQEQGGPDQGFTPPQQDPGGFGGGHDSAPGGMGGPGSMGGPGGRR